VVQSAEVLRKDVGGWLSSESPQPLIMSPEGHKTSREALSQTLDSDSSESEGYHRSSTY